MEFLDSTQDSASMDQVQCSIEKLNDKLTEIAGDYLDAVVGYYDLGFEEIEPPKKEDLISSTETLTKAFDEALSIAFGYKDGRNDDILVQIRDKILHALCIYEPVLFYLSRQGMDKYTDKKSWQFDYCFIVCLRGEKEH